ncbi:MAG: pentapeptide repeat-containing protein [Actinomycetota bacterium]|nr:pentapeptide repeat-containing protein [Actinomycetota bacterium]
MPNAAHVEKLGEGVDSWNLWRFKNPDVKPELGQADLRNANLAGVDLTGAALWQADLRGANLAGAALEHADLYNARLDPSRSRLTNLAEARLHQADLTLANLTQADLSGAALTEANLGHANLHDADLRGADLDWADLTEANLFLLQGQGADFHAADLIRADLGRADLTGANLTDARLVGTNLERANISGCRVYGTSVWKAKLQGATQTDLVVTPGDEPAVTVDELALAQLVYLLLDNERVSNFIDAVTSRAVLILGAFSPPERKEVLDAIKRELRTRGYAPILFDFEGPESRDLTTTVTTLARLSRFVLVDLTAPRSSPYEVGSFARDVQVPIRPLLQKADRGFGMVADVQRSYDWVLETHRYEDLEHLMVTFDEEVVAPAEAKAKDLRSRLRA